MSLKGFGAEYQHRPMMLPDAESRASMNLAS